MYISKNSDNEFELHWSDIEWTTVTKEELSELVGEGIKALFS